MLWMRRTRKIGWGAGGGEEGKFVLVDRNFNEP